VNADIDRDSEFCSNTVIGGNKHRIAIATRFEIEQAAKAAQYRIGPFSRSRARQRLDRLDQCVSSRNINPGIGVGNTVMAVLFLPAHAVSLPEFSVVMPI
jgi:hypothetical protein